MASTDFGNRKTFGTVEQAESTLLEQMFPTGIAPAVAASALTSFALRKLLPPKDGKDGADGAAGVAGAAGIAGPQGPKGDTGEAGPPGPAGSGSPYGASLLASFKWSIGTQAFVPNTSVWFSTARRSLVWDPFAVLENTVSMGDPFLQAPETGRYMFVVQTYLHSSPGSLRYYSLPFFKNAVVAGQAVGWIQSMAGDGFSNAAHYATYTTVIDLVAGDTLIADMRQGSYGINSGSTIGTSVTPGWESHSFDVFIMKFRP